MNTQGKEGIEMIKTIASAVKQAVFSKSFLVSWIGVVAIIAVSSIQQILEAFRADELLPSVRASTSFFVTLGGSTFFIGFLSMMSCFSA